LLKIGASFYIYLNLKTKKMAKGKKTESVRKIIDRANFLLALNGDEFDRKFKEGVIAVLEPILHSTGNYNGFHFLDSENCDVNTVGHVSRKYFGPNC
jgi:hypothetical protein